MLARGRFWCQRVCRPDLPLGVGPGYQGRTRGFPELVGDAVSLPWTP